MKLKPCPFCGGEAGVGDNGRHTGRLRFVATCNKCEAEITRVELKEAAKAWNTRVEAEQGESAGQDERARSWETVFSLCCDMGIQKVVPDKHYNGVQMVCEFIRRLKKQGESTVPNIIAQSGSGFRYTSQRGGGSNA